MFRIVRRIVRWSGEYKKRIYIGFVFAFLAGIFMSMPIIFAGFGVKVALNDREGNYELAGKDIWLLVALLAGSILGRFVFSYLKAKVQDTVAYERLADQRIQLGNILKRVNLGFFTENQTGELVSAVTTDLSFMEMHAMSMLDSVVNGYITTTVMVLYCAFIDWKLAVIALMGLLLSEIFLHRMGKCSEKNAVTLHDANEDMTSTTIEYIRGITLVKTFHQEGVTAKGIRRAYEKSRNINIKIEKEYAVCNFFHMASLKLASSAIIVVSAWMAYNDQIPLEHMIFIDILSFVVFASAENLNSAFHVLHVIDHTLDKLDRLMETVFIDETGKELAPEHFNIRFEDVSFGYAEKLVLKGISCEFPEQSFTAIVGPSGSGKTTICNLIARFYDVNEGSIRLDGKDIRDFTCASLLDKISIVFQKVYLFQDTIANNIKFGKPDATMEEVVEISKRAQCHEFISQLPEGYNTVVGEGGASLSGGERQRVSIARAMLKDAPIIILDEATSSVDPENEHIIQRALSELINGKTVIAIAHRLPTIENADQILVVENGHIVQRGTHRELIREEGIYQQFIKTREYAEGWMIREVAE